MWKSSSEDESIAPGQHNPPLSAVATSSYEQQDEDVQLMLRFKHGDQGAFQQLVDRNTPKVHALVYRFLGDPEQVEDLTQEVFLRVYRTAPRYQPRAKFSTWLYRIVANLSFNVLRSRRRGQMRQLEIVDPQNGNLLSRDVPDDISNRPDERMHNHEVRSLVAQAVNSLPDAQRIAIVLNRYENKSYEDIAQVLDCSTMAVKSLLSRARGNLRQSLERRLRPE